MSRFEDGDLVVVRDVIWTSRKGQRGRVVQRTPAKPGRASTLDKYKVVFADGQEEELWDIQLEKPILLHEVFVDLPKSAVLKMSSGRKG
jgi:hypothetical protein